MGNKLEYLTINFCEPNGDVVMTYDINSGLTTLIPNIGDEANIDGNYRVVTKRSFIYSSITIIVMIYLEETK